MNTNELIARAEAIGRYLGADPNMVPDLIAALCAERESRERAEAMAQQAADEALERAAIAAEKHGVYPELNVWGGGPEWFNHGKSIAAAIRAMKGGAK